METENDKPKQPAEAQPPIVPGAAPEQSPLKNQTPSPASAPKPPIPAIGGPAPASTQVQADLVATPPSAFCIPLDSEGDAEDDAEVEELVKASRSTRAVLEERITEIYQHLRMGCGVSEIHAIARRKGWNVSRSTVNRLIQKATKLIIAANEYYRENLSEFIFSRLEGLYLEASRQGNISLRLKILEFEWAMFGKKAEAPVPASPSIQNNVVVNWNGEKRDQMRPVLDYLIEQVRHRELHGGGNVDSNEPAQ